MYNTRLSQFPNKVVEGVKGSKFDSYLIALEAWRRGLKIQWFYRPYPGLENYNHDRKSFLGRIYTISHNNNVHQFYLSWGDKNTYDAYIKTQNKAEAKNLLALAGVSVPEGRVFYADDSDEEIIAYSRGLAYPLVLKPTSEGKGRGVVSPVVSEDHLKVSLAKVRGELNFKDIILEKYLPGQEYRLYVINDRVVSAVYRKPPNIEGDGVRTIEQLIKKKNKIRLRNPHIKNLPNPYLKVDEVAIDYLAKNGNTLNSVPKDGETVYLRSKGNFSEGSDSVDVTDTISAEIKETAVNAIKAIPGLTHAGVDLIHSNDGVNAQKGTTAILELNASAVIGSHTFPLLGKPRNIPSEIIDYYFPETKACQRTTVYFDFNSTLNPLKCGSAYMVELVKAPPKELFTKLYIIYGNRNSKIQKRAYFLTIRRYALENSLHGFLKTDMDKKIEILVSGENRVDVNNFKSTLVMVFQEAGVESIEVDDYDKPVKIGFHINDDIYYMKLGKTYSKVHNRFLYIRKSKIWHFIKPFKSIMRL